MKIFERIQHPLSCSDLEAVTLPSGRYYTTPEGKKYPSVTTVLGILSANAIREWRQRVGAEEANKVGQRAANRGSGVHTLVEMHLHNQVIHTEEVMPHFAASYRSIERALDAKVDKILFQETALYSDHLGLAGRVDLVAEFEGQLSIIDIKTSARVKTREMIEPYFMQEAAYAIMVEERTNFPVPNLVTIMAVDGQKEASIFQENRDDWTAKLWDTIKEYRRQQMFGLV